MKVKSILEKEFRARWMELAAVEAAREADESLWLLDFMPAHSIFAELGAPSEGFSA